MADMTPADMMALTGNNKSFLEGNGIIILILFFLMFGWGGAGWGGNAAAQGALTRAELSDGFNTAEILRNQSDLIRGHADLTNQVLGNRYDNAIGLANVDKSVMQSRYDAALGNAAIAQQIAENRYAAALQAQSAQAQMSTCCCDLKTAIHAEGEATRAMIQQQTIDDLKAQLNQAQTAVSNAVQTQNILSSLGRFVSNPPVNAYNGSGCCGYA